MQIKMKPVFNIDQMVNDIKVVLKTTYSLTVQDEYFTTRTGDLIMESIIESFPTIDAISSDLKRQECIGRYLYSNVSMLRAIIYSANVGRVLTQINKVHITKRELASVLLGQCWDKEFNGLLPCVSSPLTTQTFSRISCLLDDGMFNNPTDIEQIPTAISTATMLFIIVNLQISKVDDLVEMHRVIFQCIPRRNQDHILPANLAIGNIKHAMKILSLDNNGINRMISDYCRFTVLPVDSDIDTVTFTKRLSNAASLRKRIRRDLAIAYTCNTDWGDTQSLSNVSIRVAAKVLHSYRGELSQVLNTVE